MSVSLYGSGQTVIQVVSTTLPSSFSSSSSSFTPVTGLSVSITPQSTTSKILVFGTVSGYSTDLGYFALYRGSTPICIGNASGSATQATGGSFGYGSNTSWDPVSGMGFNYLDSPATTSSLTYQIYVRTSANIYLNISPGSTGSTNASTLASTITVMEISGS